MEGLWNILHSHRMCADCCEYIRKYYILHLAYLVKVFLEKSLSLPFTWTPECKKKRRSLIHFHPYGYGHNLYSFGEPQSFPQYSDNSQLGSLTIFFLAYRIPFVRSLHSHRFLSVNHFIYFLANYHTYCFRHMFGIAYGVDFIELRRLTHLLEFSWVSFHLSHCSDALISFQLHVVSTSEWKQSFS